MLLQLANTYEPLLCARCCLGGAGTWQSTNKTKPLFSWSLNSRQIDKGECKTHSGSSEEGVISDGGDGGRDVHVREGVMG